MGIKRKWRKEGEKLRSKLASLEWPNKIDKLLSVLIKKQRKDTKHQCKQWEGPSVQILWRVGEGVLSTPCRLRYNKQIPWKTQLLKQTQEETKSERPSYLREFNLKILFLCNLQPWHGAHTWPTEPARHPLRNWTCELPTGEALGGDGFIGEHWGTPSTPEPFKDTGEGKAFQLLLCGPWYQNQRHVTKKLQVSVPRTHRQKFPRDTGRGERQNDSHFTPRSENKAMTSVFTTSTQHGFEPLTSAVGKKKKGKAYRLEKRWEVPLFLEEMTAYGDYSKMFTPKTPRVWSIPWFWYQKMKQKPADATNWI